ncbi:protein cordon-bleu isoform X2 [Austrofundulus limnaeus]|uniref:Protein cordon-bleu isoform X2 n=1 Tax=Austrofundulus limnaeus TaxID=52670 RepID=A0A2I4ATN3_AUSLI|nr:PREDICTED: protein cordon-bleu isoform X2 [Austrofundulus limnaeus]
MTESSKPPSGKKMKAHAPPPPQVPQPAPRHFFRNSVPDGGGTLAMDAKENLLKPTVDFLLTLPQGYQVILTEDGSKALMDLLVELCSRHQLNPALHTLELLSPEGHSLGFKPNALLGSLNVAKVLIKEKVVEERVTRRPAPKVPEARPVKPVRAHAKKTVRLMVNYHGSQKAVVRVNPLVPLHALIPVICDKCDFKPAHVLLLKDGVSRHELPLDKSLTDLGIKELYVHDQSLVLQPKMASAPALNYSDSVCSSTTSLGGSQKKSLLNIFQFSRRKSKTEARSMDMDDFDDNTIQNIDIKSNGQSSGLGSHVMEVRSSCLGQSQSVIDIPRTSAMVETKKRRAPAPPGALTPSLGQTSINNNQVDLALESQRKRKAPAPPPTPPCIAQTSDDTSAPTAPSTDQIPTPASRNKVAQSAAVPDVSVVVQTVKPSPRKRTVQPLPVRNVTPTPSSPSLSSSTTDSLAVQDSSSEFSRSLDDSDVDLEQAGSPCSTASTESGSVKVQSTAKESISSPGQKDQDMNSDSSSRSDTELALNLKLDEVENSRHSGMAWIHSMKNSSSRVQKEETTAPEVETSSLGSSSVGSSLPDQGYIPSEVMAEGEDSGVTSSPSDTQPTSPDGSLSVDGRIESRGEELVEPPRDTSSDSDEGCATWRSKHSQIDTSPQKQSVNSFEDDSDLTAQLHQTLADLETNLADHSNMVSGKDTLFTKSTDSNEIPVSLVDMYVPVTAIDEVLDEYEHNGVEDDVKLLTKTESADQEDQGFCQPSNVEPQNKNNNAYTAAVSQKSSSANSEQFEQMKKPLENKSTGVEKEEKTTETNLKQMSSADTKNVKKEKQTLTTRSNADVQKNSRPTELESDPLKSNSQSLQKPTCNLSPVTQISLPAENNKEIQRASRNNSSFSTSQGKITQNVPSRFGMKTFTVVPPKPLNVQAAATQPARTLSTGAIKIDDQGNMVAVGISHKKSGRSSESAVNEGVPLCEKAKTFWSSNEKEDNAVIHRTALIDKTKDNVSGLSGTSAVEKKTVQSAVAEPAKTVQPMVVVKEETKELGNVVTLANKKGVEVESRSSASRYVPLPSKPALPPPLPADSKQQQLNFLKPSRRTSSKYVASAIAKYTPKTSVQPFSIPKGPDSNKSLETQTVAGVQRSGPSIQVTPSLPGTKSSTSYPEYVSNSQRDLGKGKLDKEGFSNRTTFTKEGSDVLDTKTVKNNNSEFLQKKVMDNIRKEYVKPDQTRTPALHSSLKPPVAPKITSQEHINGMKDTGQDMKPQSSATVSDSNVDAGPVAVTVFGPVKKFKPVLCKSVEKETSLHSNLMEAIQTSGGRDRLKKISTNPSNLKRTTYVEEENERSALLAAIRAQSMNRLKKTKSKAASELEQFRKETSKEERSEGSSPSPPAPTGSSPGFTSPPPPPPTGKPPPPPPVLPQGKPSSAVQTNTPMNPAMAREAMLEAIRSGSGAGKLKKVSVPTKTVQVNGRRGTIQATSSAVL